MRKKIIGIIICMLLLETAVSAVGVTNWAKEKDLGSMYVFTNTNVNYPPVFGLPSPANGSTGNPFSLYWIILIHDLEGDPFSWSIHCNNGQRSNGTGATNGTKMLALSGLAYSKTYKVWVNATDPMGSGLYTRRWFTFTTKTNNPPVFGIPAPANGSTENLLSLTWSIPINDPEGNPFAWSIHCSNGQRSNGTGAFNGTKSLALSKLTNATAYKVWVNATDPTGSAQYTRKWYTFTTQGGNLAPNKPNRPNGSSSGKPGISYTYETSTIDPNGDLVYYMWDWDDGTPLTWKGPYTSGQTATASHIWSAKGTYSIIVKAKDATGAESVWSEPLPFSTPRSYDNTIPHFLELLFDQFPNAFPFLWQLMGY